MASLVSEGVVETNAAPAAYRPPADGSHFDGNVDSALVLTLLFIQGMLALHCRLNVMAYLLNMKIQTDLLDVTMENYDSSSKQPLTDATIEVLLVSLLEL